MKLFNKIVLCLVSLLTAIVPATASAGTITYYHNDLLGSPVAATNSSGQVIWRESYRPYGERLTNSPNGSDNKVWFTSRRQDPQTGLIYMGARYYDPVVGRFITVDPAGFSEQNIHSHNRFSYANNNPYRYTDPSGRAGVAVVLTAGGILVIGGGYLITTDEQRLALLKGLRQIGEFTVIGQLGGLLSGVITASAGDDNSGSPTIDPADVAGKSAREIDNLARGKGLQPKGPDPAAGRGSYIDPLTGEQRILVHPGGKSGPHAHVNDPQGRRLDVNGNVVEPESPDAHLPIDQ